MKLSFTFSFAVLTVLTSATPPVPFVEANDIGEFFDSLPTCEDPSLTKALQKRQQIFHMSVPCRFPMSLFCMRDLRKVVAGVAAVVVGVVVAARRVRLLLEASQYITL